MVFVIGLSTRVVGLDVPRMVGPNRFVEISRWQPHDSISHLEADERIYVALVEQLDAGRGYTLQGHPLLDDPTIVGSQYRGPLFFHPPGGVVFFWLMHAVAGESGFALAQMLSFAIFFWSLMLLGYVTLRPFDQSAGVWLSLLAAFTPIMAHVAGRLWLDGPVLAIATAACAVFLFGVRRRSTALVCVSGVLLGAASWIKLTAFLPVPGVVALAWAVTPREERRGLVASSVAFVGIGALVQLPWELWQWRVLGTPFPGWAGKPADELVRTNSYVRYLTMGRSPWIFVTLLPQVLWTLAPAVVVSIAQWRDEHLRGRAVALISWIAVVSGAHVALGYLGYSKVLRYAILVSPAAAVLFAAAASSLFARSAAATAPASSRRWVRVALIVLMLAGLGLELTQSVVTTFVDNSTNDLVRPLTGLPGFPSDRGGAVQ